MSASSETLPLGADTCGEDFRDVHPNDCTLRRRKETDKCNKKPDNVAEMHPLPKQQRGQQKAKECSYGSKQKQYLAAEFVYQSHAYDRSSKVRQTDIDRL